jgi:hypothetical protein
MGVGVNLDALIQREDTHTPTYTATQFIPTPNPATHPRTPKPHPENSKVENLNSLQLEENFWSRTGFSSSTLLKF